MYASERASKQTRQRVGRGERRGEKRQSAPRIFSLFLFSSLDFFLICSKYTIPNGHISFVSHSLAHTFKHRRRRPSSFMSFLLCVRVCVSLSPSAPSSCSFGRRRVIGGSYTIIVHVARCCYTTTQQTTSPIPLSLHTRTHILIRACLYVILAFRCCQSFRFVDVEGVQQQLGVTCCVVAAALAGLSYRRVVRRNYFALPLLLFPTLTCCFVPCRVSHGPYASLATRSSISGKTCLVSGVKATPATWPSSPVFSCILFVCRY